MTDLLASGALVFVIDQWSKKSVQSLAQELSLAGVPLVRIRKVVNHNKAYRSVPVRRALVAAWGFAALSALLLYGSGTWFRGGVSQIGLAMALGGAAGNLLDILRHRSVVDFIDVGWWPAFNVADIGIVGGLLLAFCG
jgi:signal peptidase II